MHVTDEDTQVLPTLKTEPTYPFSSKLVLFLDRNIDLTSRCMLVKGLQFTMIFLSQVHDIDSPTVISEKRVSSQINTKLNSIHSLQPNKKFSLESCFSYFLVCFLACGVG